MENQLLKVLHNSRNRKIIFALLQQAAPMRRRDLSDATKISESSISKECSRLLKATPEQPAFLQESINGNERLLVPSDACIGELLKLYKEIEQLILPNLERFKTKIAEHTKTD